MKKITVKISEIDTDIGYSDRKKLSFETVSHYRELLVTNPKSLPDIVVAKNMKQKGKMFLEKHPYILVSGRHRLQAVADNIMGTKNNVYVSTDNIVTPIVVNLDLTIKTYKQLYLARVGDNLEHGLQYNETDRIVSAKLLLSVKVSQKAIAKLFGVDPSTVSKWLRPETTAKKTEKIEKVVSLKDKGKSLSTISKETDIPKTTVYRILEDVDKATEKAATQPERTIQDTTHFIKAKRNIKEARRQMDSLGKTLNDVKFSEKQLTLLSENLASLKTSVTMNINNVRH